MRALEAGPRVEIVQLTASGSSLLMSPALGRSTGWPLFRSVYQLQAGCWPELWAEN